jgi:hypothetical protein
MKKILSWIFSLFQNSTTTEAIESPMEKYLTDQEFTKIANEFNIEEACLRAVFKVEAGGKSGFLQQDPTIPVTLQEGHIFYKYAKNKGLDVNKLAKDYPTICYPKWTKTYYKTGLAEYDRYLLAKSVDEECAMLSTSWGVGQCMGFNYKACGYNSVSSFVEAMYTSESNQLRAMCNFIKSNKKMYTALQNKDFKTFASIYNGPGQVDYYGTKLEQAYNQYK